jgi:hypothetical protein
MGQQLDCLATRFRTPVAGLRRLGGAKKGPDASAALRCWRGEPREVLDARAIVVVEAMQRLNKNQKTGGG